MSLLIVIGYTAAAFVAFLALAFVLCLLFDRAVPKPDEAEQQRLDAELSKYDNYWNENRDGS